MGKQACPQCRAKGDDTTGDNLVMYEDGGSHCFACKLHTFGDGDGAVTTQTSEKVSGWTPVIGQAKALPHRKIPEEITSLYSYRTALHRGKPIEIANYYRDGILVGQKIRQDNYSGTDGPGSAHGKANGKQFFSTGDMKSATLFGQHLWRHGGRRIIVTEGEIDCLAVATLLRGKWPVVSIPNGCAGAADTFRRELEFLNSYDEVIICFDMDEPGQEAALECAKILKPGKAKIVSLPRKDAADMLYHNQSAALSTALWEAKVHRPDGIIHAKEVVNRPYKEVKIWPFPWLSANKMLYGQHSSAMTMYTSGTGMGKSTLIRELMHHHLEQGRKVGMLMLEENPEETLHDMMSLHLKVPVRKIMAARKLNTALLANGLPPIDFEVADTLTEEQYESAKSVLSDRGLYLYDHHGENLADELLSKIEYMAVSLGCDVVVLDHISVVVADMESGNERQDIDHLMQNLRSLVQQTGLHLDCVTQLRKADGKPYEEGGRITSQDLRGSASLASVPNTIIAVERNQQHTDNKVANTILVRVLKDRFAGNTGICMALRYNRGNGRLEEVDYNVDEEGEVQYSQSCPGFQPEKVDENEIPGPTH